MVPQRVQSKMAVLTFRALNGLASGYLPYVQRRPVDIPSRRRFPSAASGRLDVPSDRLKM